MKASEALSAVGKNGPPKGMSPSSVVADLISRGRPPFKVIDFPRFDVDGNSICKVFIRLLSVREEDLALANARRYVAGIVGKGDDLGWKPEELEYNARVTEIVAIACRDADDPSKPFFENGVIEAREHFNAEEFGVLAATYARLKDSTHPKLLELTESELEDWVTTIAKGVLADPFAYLPHARLAILCEYCVRSLVEVREALAASTAESGTTPTPTSS